MDRRSAIQHLLEEEGAGAVLISSPAHVRWLTGFSGSNGIVLADRTSTTLITDGRYTVQAQQEADVSRVSVAEADLYDHLLDSGLLPDGSPLLVQPEYLTGSQLERLRSRRSAADLRLGEGLFRRAVARKDPEEVDRIRKAQKVSEEVFDYLLRWIEPGFKEFEIAAEIVYQHLRRGVDRMAFEPIVAAGPNSAMPHARPSARAVEPSDVLLLDFGCVWEGYACDMTRTISIGDASDQVRRIYSVVLDAQQRAIDGASAGVLTNALDRIGRSAIEDAGYGPYFPHSLGHGVGLEIHEWPRISSQSFEHLPVHAVITIEPGIYLPDEFGVRIEDMVLLKNDGCENLTDVPKDLVEL